MQFLFSPPLLHLRRGRSIISRKGTEDKNCDQRYGAAFIQGEKIDWDLSLLKGDDGGKENDETRLNVTLGRGQLLSILHNHKIRRHQLKLWSKGKYFFYSHNGVLELSQVGISKKNQWFQKEVTIWEGQLREPLQGCQSPSCPWHCCSHSWGCLFCSHLSP